MNPLIKAIVYGSAIGAVVFYALVIAIIWSAY